MRKQAAGCLYGQAIGDALGCRYEFRSAAVTATAIVGDRRAADGFLPILGGGPFGLKAGQVTDDTEMALSLANSLITCGKFDEADIACSYVRWAQSNPKDIGITTATALSNDISCGKSLGIRNIESKLNANWRCDLSDKQKRDIYNQVVENASRYNAQSLSNGCLMRISPLAIACHRTPEDKVRTFCKLETNLTHTNPIAVDAVFVFVSAICSLIQGKPVKTVYDEAVERATEGVVKDLLAKSKTCAVPVVLSDGKKETMGDSSAIGYLGVALQGAFYELLNATTFAEGLVRTVERGGDTDTNGCITGALLGARFGADEIPGEWRSTVRAAVSRPEFPEANLSNFDQIVGKLLEAIK